MLNMAQSLDNFLQAQAEFAAWRAEFEAKWYGAAMDTQVGMLMGSMDPATRAQLRQMAPDAMAQLEGGRNDSQI